MKYQNSKEVFNPESPAWRATSTLIPVRVFSPLICSGNFEHALNDLINHTLDPPGFDSRYKNDRTGATAYLPAMLLKIVLFAYSRGIVSSRGIERACREHVTFIGDQQGRDPGPYRRSGGG
jgi:hypothetical protein